MFYKPHQDIINSIEAIGASFAIFEYSSDSNSFAIVSCNTQYENIIGQNRDDILNLSLNAIFPRYVHKALHAAFQKCGTEQVAIETELFIEYKAVERYWRSIISPIIKIKGKKPRVIQTCVEITEKKLLEKSLATSMIRFEAIVESAYDGIITIDEKHHIKLINEAAIQMFGYSQEEISGKSIDKLLPQKYRKNHAAYINGFSASQADSRQMQTRASVRGLNKNGYEFPVEITISKIRVGESIEIIATIRDLSEKNKLMDELLVAAQKDYLTNLFNRRHFSEVINNEITRSKRFKRGFSLFMIDIDYFKNINDLYGHECGDLALMNISKLMQQNIRETDIACRWGGEEFLILLPETNLEPACYLAEKIRHLIEEFSFSYNSNIIKFTVSIGIYYLNHNDNLNLDSVVNEVDQCLYTAKSEGRNKISSNSNVSK